MTQHPWLLLLGAAPLFTSCAQTQQQAETRPNIIVIYTDDQGFNDVGCYGSPNIQTPHIEQLADEGMRFTNFYVSCSVSSASRAGLLTGIHNNRNGVPAVYFPNNSGMPSEQITLGERLQTEGYRTACFGKWHLGDKPGSMPTDQGFDEYFGIPYSNDMFVSPALDFAADVHFREGWTLERAKEEQKFVAAHPRQYKKIREHGITNACPLVEGMDIVEYPCDQTSLTRRYFEHAIDFIKQPKDKPFFCYITPAMPHIPLFASEKFKGTSKRGLYGDVIQEIDYYIGELMAALKMQGLDENTLVLFSSDNGPWLQKKENGGSAKPFRAGKFTCYEGGVRMPFIARWTGEIPAQTTNDHIFASIDIVPTVMQLVGSKKPVDVDGMDQRATLFNPKEKVRDYYMYVRAGKVAGVRHGDWIYLPKSGWGNKPEAPELFNIAEDIAQNHNLYKEHPEQVEVMRKKLEEYKKQFPTIALKKQTK